MSEYTLSNDKRTTENGVYEVVFSNDVKGYEYFDGKSWKIDNFCVEYQKQNQNKYDSSRANRRTK